MFDKTATSEDTARTIELRKRLLAEAVAHFESGKGDQAESFVAAVSMLQHLCHRIADELNIPVMDVMTFGIELLLIPIEDDKPDGVTLQ